MDDLFTLLTFLFDLLHTPMRGLGVLEERIQGLIRSLMKGSNSCRFEHFPFHRVEHHRYFADDVARRMSVGIEADGVSCIVCTLANAFSDITDIHLISQWVST